MKIVVYAAVIVLIYIGCTKAYTFGTKIFTESGMEEEGRDVVITIPAGASNTEVANILKANGLIEDVNVFLVQIMLYEGEFYSGTYTLNTSYSPEDIIDFLADAAPVPVTTTQAPTTAADSTETETTTQAE